VVGPVLGLVLSRAVVEDLALVAFFQIWTRLFAKVTQRKVVELYFAHFAAL
jgi:hypothetical protein